MRVPYTWLKDYIDTDLSARQIAERLTMIGHALDKPIEKIVDAVGRGDDYVMDFEDRGNRADIMGIIGLARDLAAATGNKFSEPPTSPIGVTPNLGVTPINVQSEKVIRWTAIAYKDIKVMPSKPEIQQKLRAYGMEVINNIVDLANFVMIELGMPLHAFDKDKFSSITLRPGRAGERLITFDDTLLCLTTEDLVTADGDKPLTLTTAVGGKETGISGRTVNVLIEAGLYDQPTARRSAIRHNIRNETVSRLGKYLHPQFCQLSIERFAHLMRQLYGLEPEPGVFDYFPENFRKEYSPKIIELTPARLNLIAGEEIPLKESFQILSKLGFTPKFGVTPKKGPTPMKWVVPYFRTDVSMEDDLIEEVLRIRGFDKIPSCLPKRPSPPKLFFPEMVLGNQIRDILVKLGFNEVVSQPIIDIRDSEKAGLNGDEWRQKIIFLENSWNQELNTMRPEMISGQLKYLLSYRKQGIRDIRLFEIGKTYTKNTSAQGYKKYIETRKAALTVNSDYLTLKASVETLLRELGIRNPEFQKLDFLFKKSLGASIFADGEEVGKMGEVKSSVLIQFGIGVRVSHAVFYVSKLLKHIKKDPSIKIAVDAPKFISEDFTLVINETEEVGKLQREIATELTADDELSFTGIYSDEKLKSQGKKAVSFSIKSAATDPKKIRQIVEQITSQSI